MGSYLNIFQLARGKKFHTFQRQRNVFSLKMYILYMLAPTCLWSSSAPIVGLLSPLSLNPALVYTEEFSNFHIIASPAVTGIISGRSVSIKQIRHLKKIRKSFKNSGTSRIWGQKKSSKTKTASLWNQRILLFIKDSGEFDTF